MASYTKIGFKRGRSVMIDMLRYLVNELGLLTRQDKFYFYGDMGRESDLFGGEGDE